MSFVGTNLLHCSLSLSPHPDHPLSSVDTHTHISVLSLCQSSKHCDCMTIMQDCEADGEAPNQEEGLDI